MATKKQLSFTETVLSQLNKTEPEVLKEKIEDFKENCIIDAESQISLINTEISRKNQAIKANERKLSLFEKESALAKYSVKSSYEVYVSDLKRANDKKDAMTYDISCLEKDIKNLEELKVLHESNLAIFNQ